MDPPLSSHNSYCMFSTSDFVPLIVSSYSLCQQDIQTHLKSHGKRKEKNSRKNYELVSDAWEDVGILVHALSGWSCRSSLYPNFSDVVNFFRPQPLCQCMMDRLATACQIPRSRYLPSFPSRTDQISRRKMPITHVNTRSTNAHLQYVVYIGQCDLMTCLIVRMD